MEARTSARSRGSVGHGGIVKPLAFRYRFAARDLPVGGVFLNRRHDHVAALFASPNDYLQECYRIGLNSRAGS